MFLIDRQAKVKMSSAQLCLDYVKNKGDWPVLKDHKVFVCLSKNSKNKISKQKKTEPLKIYDGESEKKNQSKVKDSDSKVVDQEESDEDEIEDNEEDVDNEEEEEDNEEGEEEEEEESASEEE